MLIKGARRQIARSIIIDRAPISDKSVVGRIARERAEENYRFAARFVDGKTVLDVGGGLGIGHKFLLAGGACSIFSIDLLNVSRDTADDRIRIVEDDFLGHDFGDASFDAVICLGTLFYLRDAEFAVAKMHGLLKPGGILVINCINQDMVRRYFGMRLQDIDEKFSAAFDEPGFRLLLSRHFVHEPEVYVQQPVVAGRSIWGRVRFWLTPVTWPFMRHTVKSKPPGTEGMFICAVAKKPAATSHA